MPPTSSAPSRNLRKNQTGALLVTPSPLTATRRTLIIDLAARLRLPTIYSFRFYAASGGLVSYGIDQTELVREAASYVDRIQRGANRSNRRARIRAHVMGS